MTLPRRQFLKLGAAAASLAGCRVRAPVGPPTRDVRALDGKIEHFLVLMMENRSYDQMLGGLPGAAYDGMPAGTRLSYEARNGERTSVPLVHGAPPDRFHPDPGHSFHAVEAQIRSGGPGERPDMGGFARRLLIDHPSATRAQMERYTTLYGAGHLPILQGLAREYGVCSHWFCSLPSSTTPNRMFAHAGTSGGATHAGAYYSRIRGRMIFDRLGTHDPRSWRVYFHDLPHLWLAGDVWAKSMSGHFQRMGAFARDVEADELPTYSFLEPQHVLPPWSSQHPAGGVSHGERLIAHVYNTLASNPRVFEKSLLLIVYDEHGGFYDHVVPPGHPGWREQCPGVEHEVVPPDEARGAGPGSEQGYGFDTLGPRVPAVVVSPWIERGSVFGWKAEDPEARRTFDHTSILATVGRMTGVWVDSKRARAANDLACVLNRQTPRADLPRRLTFDPTAYRANATVDDDPPPGTAGVAGELEEAWRAEHGNATPAEMVEQFRQLVGA